MFLGCSVHFGHIAWVMSGLQPTVAQGMQGQSVFRSSLHLMMEVFGKCSFVDFNEFFSNSQNLAGPLSKLGVNISKTRQKTLKQAPVDHCIYFAFSM